LQNAILQTIRALASIKICTTASKKKTKVSSDEDSDIDEDAVAMLAKNSKDFLRIISSRRSSLTD
jgi:hypothetical protein